MSVRYFYFFFVMNRFLLHKRHFSNFISKGMKGKRSLRKVFRMGGRENQVDRRITHHNLGSTPRAQVTIFFAIEIPPFE